MNARAMLREPALGCAVVLGVLGDLLLRADGRPGLNVALWAMAGVVVLALLLRRRAEPAAIESRWLVGGALGFAVALALRDADALAVFALLSAVVLLGLAAGRAASAWATHAQVSDVALAALRQVVLCVAGPIGWGRAVANTEADSARWTPHVRTAARGGLIALPALVVLTALLMSADPVFAQLVDQALPNDIEPLLSHVVGVVLIGWLTAGYLRTMLVADHQVTDRLRLPRPALAAAEISVALWLLNGLFAVFVIVQLRYLFGGADLVEVTAGLGYAEYARRGFFELVATATLVVPLLLLADWAANQGDARARSLLRLSMLVLVVLLLGVIASAAYRMRLYQHAYGLTELRLYVSVFIVWLVATLAWLVLTVMRGRRERFLFGSIVAGLACVAALHVLNPHAVIVRVNIDRAAAGAEVDTRYLRSLSADAVPALVERLDALPATQRCRVAQMLVERWHGQRPGGWRSWNLGDWRARRLVRSPDMRKIATADTCRTPEEQGIPHSGRRS